MQNCPKTCPKKENHLKNCTKKLSQVYWSLLSVLISSSPNLNSKSFATACPTNGQWAKHLYSKCLVFLQIPKCFVSVQMFWTRTLNGIIFSTAPSRFVLVQKVNLLKGNHLLVSHKKFGTGTKYVNSDAKNLLHTLCTGAENYWNDVFFSLSIAIKIIDVDKRKPQYFLSRIFVFARAREFDKCISLLVLSWFLHFMTPFLMLLLWFSFLSWTVISA